MMFEYKTHRDITDAYIMIFDSNPLWDAIENQTFMRNNSQILTTFSCNNII